MTRGAGRSCVRPCKDFALERVEATLQLGDRLLERLDPRLEIARRFGSDGRARGVRLGRPEQLDPALLARPRPPLALLDELALGQLRERRLDLLHRPER